MNTLTQPIPVVDTPVSHRCPYLLELRGAAALLRTPAFALPMFLLPLGTYVLFAFAVAGEAIDQGP